MSSNWLSGISHRQALSFLFLCVLLFAREMTGQFQQRPPMTNGGQMLQLTSPAFQAGGNIPARFTCQGSDISPALAWQDAPSGTKTFALVMHDPDAPRAGGFTHWVVYNIPATTSHIAENAPKKPDLPGGGTQGQNDSGKIGYAGPCPPSGTHRYFFRLYALDAELKLDSGATQKALEKAMQGHILAQTEIVGKYKKSSERAA